MFRKISLLTQFIFSKLFGFRSKKRLEKLKGSEKGKSCYIFGDGVSLKYFDLNFFNDKDIIAANHLMIHDLFPSLNVKYYTFYEPFYFYPLIRKYGKFLFNKMFLTVKNLMMTNEKVVFFSSVTNIPLVGIKNLIFLSENSFKSKEVKDLTRRFNCFEGSLRLQLLIAIYLGYDQATLVGHDYTHSPSMAGHFYEYGKGNYSNHDLWNADFFEDVKKKIKITTLTIDSKSNRLNYLKYPKEKVSYKENTAIISSKLLNKMNTFSYYKIFR
jgi:hypothetical protein